jgi:hypothetical protein
MKYRHIIFPELVPTSTDKYWNSKKYKKLLIVGESNCNGYKSFDRLCKSMNEVLNEILCEHIHQGAMFYNYFLRPATIRENIRSCRTQLDRDIAGSALNGIIDLDHPDVVIFISKYAFLEFNKYMTSNRLSYDIPIDFINHPAIHFSWNHRNGNGKQKFEKLLREYWIVK